jgi:protein O-mannosyl-transferase
MHVESVAWVAERKDVLCALFWLLCVWSYADYARQSGAGHSRARVHYLRAITFFVLALMSKPMAVTLPFVLLLLDYWPLQRLKASTMPRLILEKLPFLGLTLVSCIITFAGTSKAGNILSTETVSWGARLANVPVSYARYVSMLIWPTKLTVLYPLVEHWETWQV